MKPTRRQFVQTALGSAAALAMASKSFAQSSGQQTEDKNSGWKTIKTPDGSQMRTFVAYPKNVTGKVPGIIVLQEVFGVNAYIRDVTQRIAALGYVAVAPELFHRTAPGFEGDYVNTDSSMEQMKKMTDAGLEADLQAAYSLLTSDDRVDASRIGSVGFCMGGRASFVANAVLPLKAAISYYGAGIDKIIDRAKDQHAPILLFWGGKDTHIGRDKEIAVADGLRSAGKVFSEVEFSDAEHGFFCDVRKSYNPVAARESWALLTEYFKEHLA
jgi:carboxymethylenebutenolidase